MWFLRKIERFERGNVKHSVVYTYSVEDTPRKMIGVKVPRESMTTAKWALIESHSLAEWQSSKDRDVKVELAHVVQELKKAEREKRSIGHGDYYVLGPNAAHVGEKLTAGANFLESSLGREVLKVEHKVLTNHECVDIFRIASNRHAPAKRTVTSRILKTHARTE